MPHPSKPLSALTLLIVVVFLCGATQATAQTTSKAVAKQAEPNAASVVAETVSAANAFLKTLEQKQYKKVQYSFTDDKQRENWSNLPVGMVPRGGLRWGDLSDKQQAAVMAMLKAALSENGVQQIVDNMNGD